MNNKLQQTGSNVAEILIVVAILVLVNWLGYKFFARLDLTQNHQYTVSKSTKDVLKGLDDPVNVTVYMSSELPPQMQPVKRTLRETLQEYSAYGHGKFLVRYVDPKDDQKLKEKAANEGVQESQVQVTEKDQALTKKIFFGVVLNYGTKSETIDIGELAQQDSLEYALTSRIVRLKLDKKPRIGVFEGSFVASQQQRAPTFQAVQQLLGGSDGLYEIVRIDPKSDKQLPDDLNGVVLLGTFGLSEQLKYSIDQYLLNGGQVLVAIDPMMDLSQMQQNGGLAQAYPSLPTYEPELEKYGVKLEKKLVVEPNPASSAQVSVPSGIFTLLQQYPLWPKIGPKGFNPKVAAVGRLQSLIMPWACPLFPSEAAGVDFQPLFSSSKQAFVYNSPFDLNPQQDWQMLATKSDTKGPYTLGAMLSGKFPTAFPGGPPAPPPPPAPDQGAEGQAPAAVQPFDASKQVKEGNGQGRLIVISSAKALSDNFMKHFQENALFLANGVDMLAYGNELLNIRSTPVTQRPLKPLDAAQKQVARWANVLGPSILLALFGFVLWVLKNKRRQAMQNRYSGGA
jgi:gliding-associated putative ABC transporter substrate-binding component GldG